MTVQQDTFARFQSRVGNEITCPSKWETEDQGALWTLYSPDRQARIIAYTVTVEGNGSIEQFQQTATSSIREEGEWKPSNWEHATLDGGIKAFRREFWPSVDSTSETREAWIVFVIETGPYYHAIALCGTLLAMELNKDFYESLVQTFSGIS